MAGNVANIPVPLDQWWQWVAVRAEPGFSLYSDLDPCAGRSKTRKRVSPLFLNAVLDQQGSVANDEWHCAHISY